MRIAFYLNIISPHQLPFAKAVVELIGEKNFAYIYAEKLHSERAQMGWNDNDLPNWCKFGDEHTPELMEADIVYTGMRCFDLIEQRCQQGKKTVYVSERWLKPNHGIPGWLRLLHPGYFKMVRRFVTLFDYPAFRYLPQGKWAERDMAFLCRVMGRTMLPKKVVPWGYFVAPSSRPSTFNLQPLTSKRALRVLWVGRMIGWKRVDTIIKAIKSLDPAKFSLTLVGNGDRRDSLIRLAEGATNIIFKDSIPIAQIRDEMRANDIYVLSSNGEEGWGAALNEAMEEGMFTLGTFEAGASSYMLPDSHKFYAGDWRRLSELLQQVADGKVDKVPIGEWTAENAAERLLAL